MVLDQQMLHLSLEDPRPVNFAMVVTPPAESELGHQDKTAAGLFFDPATTNLSSPTARATTNVNANANAPVTAPVIDAHPMARMYRCTPTPTILLDGFLRVIQASDSHLNLFKYDRKHLLGSSVYELTPRIIPAPGIASLSGALGAAITTREVQIIEDFHVQDHDSEFTLRVTPIFDGDALIYVLMEAQITRRSKSAPKISEQTYFNETYRTLIDTVKDYAIFMLDIRGHIATWNSGAAILKGYTADEIIGQHFSIFYGPEDRETDKPGRELEVCLREGKVEDEGWRYRKDGGQFWANVMITPYLSIWTSCGFRQDHSRPDRAEGRRGAAD